MSERYKVVDSTMATFITITIVDWVDLFTRYQCTELVLDSLRYCQQEKGLIVHAYVVMSSHVHLIVSTDGSDLASIVRDFKKFTSKKLIELIKDLNESRREWLLAKFEYAAKRIKRGKNYKVWKDGFHPITLDTNHKRSQRIHYIHMNPVEARIVKHERDYLFSSYRAYEGERDDYLDVKPLF